MPAGKDKQGQYECWKKEMAEKNMRPVIRLTEWFFRFIDAGELNIEAIIFLFKRTGELMDAFGISEEEKGKAFLAVKAVVNFHEHGEAFRLIWNQSYLGELAAYVLEERGKIDNKRYIHNPFIK